MVTVLTEQGPVDVSADTNDDGALWLSVKDAEAVSGWAMKAQGLCRGDICLPVPGTEPDKFVRDGSVNLPAFWRRMDKPFAHSERRDIWVFGEASEVHAAALETLMAPDFSLPDLDGNSHALSDFRGKKVLLATWASW